MKEDSLLKIMFKKTSVAISLVYVFISILMALFCYLLAPDNTNNANTILMEIANCKPFTSVKLFEVPKKEIIENSFINTLIYGKNRAFDYYPFDNYIVKKSGEVEYRVYSQGDTTAYDFKTLKINNPAQYVVQKTFILGTDKYGRDILSRLMIGSRVSLGVGIISVFISILLGTLLGSIAGYFGGKVDRFLMWVINVFWAIPTVLLVFAIVISLGKSFWLIFIAIGITMWIGPARIIRGQVISLKENNYIKAAQALGFSSVRIIFRSIIPNLSGIIIVLSASNFATAILIEAGLSFLGVGIQPPMSSWGLMVKEHYHYLITDNPFPTLVPGIAIMISVLSFNIIGNALRDIFDVRNES